MKSVVLFILTFSFTFTQAMMDIDSSSSNFTDFKIGYYIDSTKKLKFEDIKSIKFIESKNSATLGANITDTWVKIELFNSTENKQILFLHQDLAYTFLNIEYYEVDNKNNLLNKKKIDISSPNAKEQMYGADAIYEFSLAPKEAKTIYVYQKTNAYHFYNFSIFSQKESTDYLIYEKVDGILFVGLLLALAIYNLFIYLSSRYKEYLYYSLYLFSATIWIFYMYGSLAHYFHIYGEIPFRFNFALMFIPIFLALFVQSIFDTKIFYKTEHKFLNIMIAILSTNFIYGLVDFNHALQLLSLELNYTLVTFLWISISIYKKGNKIVKIFLYAHIFYIIFNVYTLLFYMGIVEFSYIAYHGIGIGIMIEALMLSYLVSYKFKIIEREKKESQLLLLEKSKMADMGEMVANIAHQWRQPLSLISTASTGLLVKKELDIKTSKEEDIKVLNTINDATQHLSETINAFRDFFHPNKEKVSFKLSDVYKKTLNIVETRFKNLNIEIIEELEDISITNLDNELIQVIMNLLNNARDILEISKNNKKLIFVKIYKEEKHIVISVKDNGGGINNSIIDKVFEPYFTTKHKSQGTGIGLYMCQEIITKHMNGTLEVSNQTYTYNSVQYTGAQFKIIFPNN